MARGDYVGGGSAAVRPGTGRRGYAYTNFSDMLSANKDFDSKVTEKANALGRDLTEQGKKKTEEANSLSYTPKTTGLSEVANLVGANDQSALRSGMHQKYSGPRQSSINLQKLQSFGDLKKLGDAKSAGAMIADPKQAYTGGMRSFDEALFSGSGALGQVNKYVDTAKQQDDAANKLFADKVSGFDKSATDASRAFRGALQKYYQNLSSNLDDRVKQEIAAEANAFRYGKTKNPDAIKVASGQLGMANRNNMVTQDEANRFATLAAVLGTEGVQRDPSYKRAMVQEISDPNSQLLTPEQKPKLIAKMNANDAQNYKYSPTGVRMGSQQEVATTKEQIKKATGGGGMTGSQVRKQLQNTGAAKDKKRNVNAGKDRRSAGDIG